MRRAPIHQPRRDTHVEETLPSPCGERDSFGCRPLHPDASPSAPFTERRRVSLDGITTIAEAIAACRQSGLQGWELVAYAQQLAARKFTYSRLNPWDTPARAFVRGRGYCQQQALALQKIYDGLGIPARSVFARRCTVPAKMVDGMPSTARVSGHVWLRVKIGDEERDVCPGSTENAPGVTQFEVVSQVRPLTPLLRPFTHLGSVIENIRRDAEARWAIKRRADDPSGDDARSASKIMR